MKIALAGAGFFGCKHLEALQTVEEADVTVIVEPNVDLAKKVAQQYGVPTVVDDLKKSLAMEEVDAVILCTPTPVHAEQAIWCMQAGKHVEVEIPVADSLVDAERVLTVQKETGLVCTIGHTRRFNPSHQWLRNKIKCGQLTIQQMDVQTYFFRRSNINALGEPRPWTDHLLWHHAAHTVDLFQYQTGEQVVAVNCMEGPHHLELGIAMDMSIQMKTETGIVLTLSLSFNNDGPLGTFFRYICDKGTYVARYDDLVDGYDNEIDVSQVDISMNGVELQDRAFLAAIRGVEESPASISNVIECYRMLDQADKQL